MAHAPPAGARDAPESSAVAVAAAGLIALAVAMGIGRFAFTPILPMMQEDAGLSVAAGGWLAAANYIGYLVGALSATVWRARPATVIRVGLAAIAFTTFAMGVSNSPVAWAAWRAAAGVASAWVLVQVSAWSLGQLARHARPRLSGVVYAGVGTGIAAAGAVCLILMQLGASSPLAWMALGLLALVGTAAVWPAVGRGAATAPAAPAPTAQLAWNGERRRLVACYGAFGFGYIIPATFLPAMAKEIVADPAVFGWSWPAFGLAAAASTLAAAPLQRFVTNRRLWIGTHLVMAAGVTLPALAPGLAPILAAAALVGGTFMVTTMVGLQEGRRAGGTEATRLIAAMTAAFAAGQILGPLAAAGVVAITGSLTAALLAAAAALIVGACALLPGRRKLAARETAAEET